MAREEYRELVDIGDVEYGSDLHKQRERARSFKNWCESSGDGEASFDSGGNPERMVCETTINGDFHEVIIEQSTGRDDMKVSVNESSRDSNGGIRASQKTETLAFHGRRLYAENDRGHTLEIRK